MNHTEIQPSTSLYSIQHQQEIQNILANLEFLQFNFDKYRTIPLNKKTERNKNSTILFRIFWNNVLKIISSQLYNESATSFRLLMRYALLSTHHIQQSDLDWLRSIPFDRVGEKPLSHKIYYLDEWIIEVINHVGIKNSNVMKESQGNAQLGPTAKSQVNQELIKLEKWSSKTLDCSQNTANPFLCTSDLTQSLKQQIASRQVVMKILSLVEGIDTQLFMRKLKKETVYNIPNIILIPSYSESGHCCQAYDRNDKIHSSGVLIMPLYPPNAQNAVIQTLANYRWEMAKLTSGSFWLEKGLTGEYYDLFRSLKLPGRNEQHAFVKSYSQWIMDESRGQHLMHPDIRKFFWTQIPFTLERKKLLIQHFPQFQSFTV